MALEHISSSHSCGVWIHSDRQGTLGRESRARHLVSPGWLHAAGIPFGCQPYMVSDHVRERMAHGVCCKVCSW